MHISLEPLCSGQLLYSTSGVHVRMYTHTHIYIIHIHIYVHILKQPAQHVNVPERPAWNPPQPLDFHQWAQWEHYERREWAAGSMGSQLNMCSCGSEGVIQLRAASKIGRVQSRRIEQRRVQSSCISSRYVSSCLLFHLTRTFVPLPCRLSQKFILHSSLCLLRFAFILFDFILFHSSLFFFIFLLLFCCHFYLISLLLPWPLLLLYFYITSRCFSFLFFYPTFRGFCSFSFCIIPCVWQVDTIEAKA